MTTPVVSVNDGPRITVNDLIGNPLMIPTKLKELMLNQFISEALFRNEGENTNGLVGYHEGHPTFLEQDVQDVAEGAEIPVATSARGVPTVVRANKRGLAIRISREMQKANNVGEVQRQINQLRNTFIRADDKVARTLLQSSLVPTLPVANEWDDTTNGNPRLDLATAIREVTEAAPNGASTDEWYGFVPDTIVLNPGLLPTLLDNEKFLKVYQGNVADQNISYTGALPSRIFGLDVIQSMAWPTDEVTVLQRGVVGFYSDMFPLEITGLYPEGNGPLSGPTQSYRCDATHTRAIALDQPKAAIRLTGLLT
ncbi:hypothetical protein HZU38_05365 [Mycolicibacterium vanbaalenii]|uniref:phage major capsid protein n=1 Tax=Mycolicibacterium vanbaalenii TaxID=110539 RepID=UPI001F208BD4|nr:hypothetical protein [Mycolicibacterium vanbaalenii]UJL29930.1 hypothetical protein HZU38_05365 [Mycolicibacterium vanbaalenii]WND57008.1 hypothetical protein QQA43_00900 [Mycolicibacterium vanbaalenii]